jgi:predicted membrane protein
MSANSSSRNSGLWIGLIVVSVGIFLFIDRLDLVIFPHWLFSWEVLLIVIGLAIGVKKNFKSVGWLVLVLLGTFFLLDDIPGFEFLRPYAFPIGVIVVGFFLIVRSATRPSVDYQKNNASASADNTSRATGIFGSNEQHGNAGGAEDFVDLLAVFGGIKKRIFSKSFKGGKTTNLFGGTELDLTQADIEGTAVLDIAQAFGSVEIIVPANWEVKSDITTILGGIDDKRSTLTAPSGGKKLILTGTCIFGGVDIKSF